MEKFDKFIEVIKEYATAYRNIEDLQKNDTYDFIPKKGDQKTGLIGEAFVFEYLKRQGFVGLNFGTPNQKGWDIRYDFDLALNNEVLIQVKTTSVFAERQRLSPIHLMDKLGYGEILLIKLNENLLPINLWRVGKPDRLKIKTINGEEVLKGARMPKNETDYTSGFGKIENLFDDFQKKFPELYK